MRFIYRQRRNVKQVLPDMIEEMCAANDRAAKKGWRASPEDESDEHPNEYVGVLIDNYYDLWTVRDIFFLRKIGHYLQSKL